MGSDAETEAIASSFRPNMKPAIFTVAANVVYVPAKLAYAALGGITGSFAYVLTGSNYQVAERVWAPSLGGDYILSRRHIRGQEPINFSAAHPSADATD